MLNDFQGGFCMCYCISSFSRTRKGTNTLEESSIREQPVTSILSDLQENSMDLSVQCTNRGSGIKDIRGEKSSQDYTGFRLVPSDLVHGASDESSW